MKNLILIIFILSPFKQVENIRLTFPSQQHDIFLNYSNDNFSQELIYKNGEITAELKCSDYFDLNLNFEIFPDLKFIKKLNQDVKDITIKLLRNRRIFKTYLKKITTFLKKNITYSTENLPQDIISVVLNKKANCVGYSNLIRVLLNSAGIKNKIQKGFYLQNGRNKTLIPIPHQWIEITLPNSKKFFFDPQYQNFSVNYIVVKDTVNFTKVKKFKIRLIMKSKKIIN